MGGVDVRFTNVGIFLRMSVNDDVSNCYSLGLRLSEVVNLRVEDINKDRIQESISALLDGGMPLSQQFSIWNPEGIQYE